MPQLEGRYTALSSPSLAEGFRLTRATPPSRLFGANGLRTGPDGRIYIAQVVGSQITALDLATGALEAVVAKGGDIIAPDDLAFDTRGNLYATEVYDGRVSVRGVDGRTRVLRDDLPSANGVTVHNDRLFVNECRIGGRLMELSLDGAAPRVLLENIPMPNAMEVGPDGLLYFPVMATGEIWRIKLEGGAVEKVASNLVYPDAVKFDRKGFIVATEAATGRVLRIDPRNGASSVLAQLEPGLDNCTFADGRLFVSNFTGQISEVLAGGETRTILPGGLGWPLDLTVTDAGTLYIADGTHVFQLLPGGRLRTVGMMLSPGYPGVVRGLAAAAGGEFIVTNTNGQISRYRPERAENEVLAEGLDSQLYGVATAPSGAIVVAALTSGRVLSVRSGQVDELAAGLREPMGVAFADGACLVSESGGGRVVQLAGSRVETLVEGLERPQGIFVRDGMLYIVDAGAKTLIGFDLKRKTRTTLASELPVGAPRGITPKPLRGMPPFSGPQGPFAGIAGGPSGPIYVSADAEGSVLAFSRAEEP